MVAPLVVPIIMAVAAMGAGLAQGISERKNAKAEAKALQASAQAEADERARNAKKLMSQQKTSFLKSGVYFSGTPQDIINETFETYQKDLQDMMKDTGARTKNLYRQGKTAFYSNLIKGAVNAAESYYSAGGTTGKFGSAISNKVNSVRSGVRGGFGTVQTTNGLPTTSGNMNLPA